jgi:hypothetical protein
MDTGTKSRACSLVTISRSAWPRTRTLVACKHAAGLLSSCAGQGKVSPS